MHDAWREQKIGYSTRMFFRDEAGSAAQTIGGWQVAIAVLPAAVTALGMWLSAKQGRKLRLKVGSMEFEASTVEELKALVDVAKAIDTRLPDN